jgi:hypothetical protein
MDVLMTIQTALLTECLIAYFTGIMALTTKYAFMPYQTTFVNAYFIKHITNIKQRSPLCTCSCLIRLLLSLYDLLHHKHKGAHHYACIYV